MDFGTLLHDGWGVSCATTVSCITNFRVVCWRMCNPMFSVWSACDVQRGRPLRWPLLGMQDWLYSPWQIKISYANIRVRAANCEFTEMHTQSPLRIRWNSYLSVKVYAKSGLDTPERSKNIAGSDFRILYLYTVCCLIWCQDALSLESILPGMSSGPSIFNKLYCLAWFQDLHSQKVYCLVWSQDPVFSESVLPGLISGLFIAGKNNMWVSDSVSLVWVS